MIFQPSSPSWVSLPTWGATLIGPSVEESSAFEKQNAYFCKYWAMETEVTIKPAFSTKIHKGLSKGTDDVNLLLEVSTSRNGIQDL